MKKKVLANGVELAPKRIKVKLGDWIEIEEEYGSSHTKRHHEKVTGFDETSGLLKEKTIVTGSFEFTLDGTCYDGPVEDNYHPSYRIIRVLKPSEVAIDFGNGIRGTLQWLNSDHEIFVVLVDGYTIAWFRINHLKPSLQKTVLELLDAKEKP